MPAPLEIGDIVVAEDGQEKLVVNIFRNADKEVCCQCVDADDSPEGDVDPPKIMYKRSQVEPVFHPNRYQV